MAENVEPKKKSAFRTIIVIAGMLLGEAAVIVGVMMYLGGPETVQAADGIPELEAEGEKIVEVLVLDDRLPNNRSGINYLYETEIWVHVRNKHKDRVANELEQFRNELKAELLAIWRTAEPRHLQEPKMENLTRKVHAMLQARFGTEANSEEPVIQKCVIVSGPGFRVEG